jgi:hypothetical protein
MSDLRELLSRALAAEGALVEPIEPEGLEIMAPPQVQQALALPEWSRVGFGAELPGQAVRVSFESDWAERLEKLLGERGRLAYFFSQERPYPAPRQEFEKAVQREFTLQNATFRLGPVEEARARYLLLVFRMTATSDEKREDLVTLCINESNGALANALAGPLLSHLRAADRLERARPDEAAQADAWPAQQIRARAAGLLMPRIRVQLSPFLAGMERRMARDLERLHAYHSDLRKEAAARRDERKRNGASEDALKADQMRLEAIEREYHTKVADLRRKYAMSVEIRFLQALRVDMPVRRAAVTVLRRKSTRQTHLDWNPITRRFDLFPCEGCWTSPRVYCVCDDRLHWVCPSCFCACPSCGKESCRACHPAKCAKCAHPWSELC